MIKIKPHHFLDIIKLYGKGIEFFVPDEKYHHNFYSIANEIIKDNRTYIHLTVNEDDICSPCKYLKNGLCIDTMDHILGFNSKGDWNKTIDQRILEYTKIPENSKYTAMEYCKVLYSNREYIFDIWKEEPDSAKENRYENFCLGAEKYLGI